MHKGLFITLEGVDGVGKTTQALLLKTRLEQKGQEVLHTFEPGGTALGSRIRQLLLDPNHAELSSMTEILLYAADRAQHVHEQVLPALKAGKTVLCERFVDSSLAYQGYGLGLDLDAIRAVNHWATGAWCRTSPSIWTPIRLSVWPGPKRTASPSAPWTTTAASGRAFWP